LSFRALRVLPPNPPRGALRTIPESSTPKPPKGGFKNRIDYKYDRVREIDVL